jgi:hypothetical protein
MKNKIHGIIKRTNNKTLFFYEVYWRALYLIASVLDYNLKCKDLIVTHDQATSVTFILLMYECVVPPPKGNSKNGWNLKHEVRIRKSI